MQLGTFQVSRLSNLWPVGTTLVGVSDCTVKSSTRVQTSDKWQGFLLTQWAFVQYSVYHALSSILGSDMTFKETKIYITQGCAMGSQGGLLEVWQFVVVCCSLRILLHRLHRHKACKGLGLLTRMPLQFGPPAEWTYPA